MATYATLTVTVRDIIGADFHESRASVWIEPNTVDGLILADGIRVGGRREQLVGGTATFANLVTTNSADNPTSFGYRVTISAPPKGASKREDMIVLTTSDFPLTGNANLKDISAAWDNITIPPNFRSDFLDQAQAILDQQEAIAGADTADDLITILDANAASDFRQQQDARLLSRGKVVPAAHADTYGHSFMFGSTTGTGGSSTGVSDMATLIANGLGLPINQHAVSGAALYTSASAGDWADIMQSEARGVKFEPRGGAYAVMYGLNDAANVGRTYSELAPFKSALIAVTARMRAAAVFENDHPSMATSGTWTVNTSTGRNSGSSYSYANTAGATQVWTPPAEFPGGTVTAVLPAYGDGGSAVWSAVVNGITYTVNTADYALSGNNPTVGVMRIPNVKRSNGPITFTVTSVSGSGAARAMWDCVMWEPAEAACPVVALIGQPKPLDYTSQADAPAGPVTDAGVDVINQIISEVVDLFGDRVVYVDTSAIDKSASYWAAGNVHPNGAGHAHIANQTIAAIKSVAALIPASAKDAVSAVRADVWINYNPTVTGITLGNGAILAAYSFRENGSVDWYAKITLGSTSAVTGEVTVELPTAAVAGGYTVMGFRVFLFDNGTARYQGGAYLGTVTAANIRSIGTNGVLTALSATSPFTWTDSDAIEVGGSYRRA